MEKDEMSPGGRRDDEHWKWISTYMLIVRVVYIPGTVIPERICACQPRILSTSVPAPKAGVNGPWTGLTQAGYRWPDAGRHRPRLGVSLLYIFVFNFEVPTINITSWSEHSVIVEHTLTMDFCGAL